MQLIFDGERPQLIQVEVDRIAEFTKWTQEGDDWILTLEMALELRFDRKVEVIEIRPDEGIRSVEWVYEEGTNDWVLVILFGRE